jgi:putative ABC transport system permease protein
LTTRTTTGQPESLVQQEPTFTLWSLRAWSPGSLLGLLRVVGQRLWNHLMLMLAIAAGFVVAITLVVCIPIYSEAVGYRILRTELSRTEEGSNRPPFAFLYRYAGATQGAIRWDAYQKLDNYMRDSVAQQLGLPVEQQVRYVASDRRPLWPASGAGAPLMWVNLAFASDFEAHIDLVDGQMPQVAADGPVEVLLVEELATKLGFQVGEEYLILGPEEDPARIRLPIRVAGVWRAKDSSDGYWFYRPDTFGEIVLMPEESFTSRVLSRDPESISVALWHVVTDGSGIRSADVPSVRAAIARSATQANTLLPGARLENSPASALDNHQAQVRRLTLILTVFSVPLLGLIAYFIVLIAGLIVQRQSNEIAVLRSRGASRVQVLGIYLLEGLLLGVIALGIGLLLGQVAALLMTWTRSFLELAPAEELPIELTADAWRRATQMLVLMLIASLLPAFGAARYTVVAYKNERARATRAPFWQRVFLDLLLLIPVYYGYQQLRQHGTISFLSFSLSPDDPFANPLLLLAPTLYIFALALIATRLFPLLMRGLSVALNHLPGVAIVTALRYLARTPRAYVGPVLLLVLTLSLAIFTSSMAVTLDQHLYDQIYYETGGDMRLFDWGQGAVASSAAAAGAAQAEQTTDALDEAKYYFFPVSDYTTIPGVVAATRVAQTTVDLSASGNSTPARFVGLDRAEFPQVARWRSDYAPESLGALMNYLADDPAAVLVSSGFAAQRGLRVGDKITLVMNDLDVRREAPAVVAGFVNLFPTLYPEEGPIVVGNLDYAFDQQGGQYPYEVWMRLADGTTREAVNTGVAEMGIKTFDRGYALTELLAYRARPERQGLFGLLSVGFVAAAFLTVLGFLFYSVLSFQRRFVELGMLRAIGLSARQLGALLAWEQTLIIGAGMLAGTLIGITASELFIPFLQVRGGTHPNTPPFAVQLDWNRIGIIYVVFGAMLILAVLVMLVLLRRMKLFQAVKLGEAI